MGRIGVGFQWLALSLFLNGLIVSSASAQRFFPFLPPDPRDRVQGSAYLARWEFPAFEALGAQSETLDPDPSALLTMDYSITRYLWVGGWWNPFRGSIQARVLA